MSHTVIQEEVAPRNKTWLESPVLTYYLILGSALALLTIGLVMVLSSTYVTNLEAKNLMYKDAQSQGIFAGIGLLLMIVALNLKPKHFQAMAPFALVLAVVLQVLVFSPLGKSVSGNRSWIVIAGQSLQPSELGKIALCVILGTVLARKMHKTAQFKDILVPVLGVWCAPLLLLVMLGKDLGTTLVLMLITFMCLVFSGIQKKYLGGLTVIGLLILIPLTLFNENRLGRIMATYGECSVADDCYQVQRSLEGLGTGGLTGAGLGAGKEKWSYLPEAHNDFIFSVIGEELGFLGALCVLVLFLILGYGILRLIRRSNDPMVKITSAGIGAWLVGQAFLNIGMAVKLFPVIGIPLPFISAGGSALVAVLIAVGVLLSFARQEDEAAKYIPVVSRKNKILARTGAVISKRKTIK